MNCNHTDRHYRQSERFAPVNAALTGANGGHHDVRDPRKHGDGGPRGFPKHPGDR